MSTRSIFDGTSWQPAGARYLHDGTNWNLLGGGGGADPVVPTAGGAGDVFAQRIALDPNATSFNAETTADFAPKGFGADVTAEADEPNLDNGIRHTVWFTWSAPAEGDYTFSLLRSGFDTILAIFTAPSSNPTLADLVLLDWDDDFGDGMQSQVTVHATAGQKLYLQVGGYGGGDSNGFGNGGYGFLVLDYYPADPVGGVVATAGGAGDLFAQRIALTSGTRFSTDTTDFDVETGEPNVSSGARHTAWFTWVAPADGDYTFSLLRSSFDTVLAVYSAPSADPALTDLVTIGSNDDFGGAFQSQVTVHASAGQTLYLQAAGYGNSFDSYGHLVLDYPDPSI